MCICIYIYIYIYIYICIYIYIYIYIYICVCECVMCIHKQHKHNTRLHAHCSYVDLSGTLACLPFSLCVCMSAHMYVTLNPMQKASTHKPALSSCEGSKRVPIVPIVLPCLGLTSYLFGILRGNRNHNGDYRYNTLQVRYLGYWGSWAL